MVWLEEQLAELNGAIGLTKSICQAGTDLASFDEEYYWSEVRREEKQDRRFMDIAMDVVKDYASYQKSVFLEEFFWITDEDGERRISIPREAFSVFVICLIWGLLRFFTHDRNPKDF